MNEEERLRRGGFEGPPESHSRVFGARPGRRVRLIAHSDEFSKLRFGTLGTVRYVDDFGTIHVDWDDGSTLGLIPGVDQWDWADAPA